MGRFYNLIVQIDKTPLSGALHVVNRHFFLRSLCLQKRPDVTGRGAVACGYNVTTKQPHSAATRDLGKGQKNTNSQQPLLLITIKLAFDIKVNDHQMSFQAGFSNSACIQSILYRFK